MLLMTPERWQRLKEILTLDAAQRAAACGEDVSLRREVEEMVACQEEMGNFLEDPLPTESEEVPDELRQWERFDVRERLGSGGMATVYKAWDARLKRFIAVKMITPHDEMTVKRFVREAEAQARIDHPNVLKVFETGIVGRYHYIAMQLVDGPELLAVRHETTLEEKLDLIIRIGSGLQEAHRHGLVHRDIKPGNVLVERTEEGWKPYLLDFGLAVDAGSPSLTGTGVVIGTPRYMAPERVAGGTAALDRRSDIYSLGATCYEFLSGVAPFAGSSALQALIDVMESEIAPLRTLLPSIPPEVEAIVMKCLERDPIRRYASARALAEDLQRYRDGEPVLARPAGMLQRMVRRLRKHPRLSAAFATLGLVTVALAGWGGWTQWHAGRQAELARTVGQDVRDMEWLFRAGQMSPLHPIAGEQREVRARIAELKGLMSELGSDATGPGQYAIGRGLLTLDERPAALEHLQRAWQSGYRTADAAAALGLTHGELYRVELERARRIDNERERDARIRQLQKVHRDPALKFLSLGRSSTIMPPRYIAALIAALRDDVPGALENAELAARGTPWLYEARVLQGDLELEEAVKAYFKSEPRAAELVVNADRYYAMAQQIAESAIDPHLGRCAVAGLALHMHQHRYATDAELAERVANESCTKALTVQPSSGRAYRLYAEAIQYRATLHVAHNEDPGDAYDRAVALATRAVEFSPGDPQPVLTLADALLDRAWWEGKNNRDPRLAVHEAVLAYDKALAIDPRNTTGMNNVGQAFRLVAQYEAKHGLDPIASLDASIESFERALRADPELSFGWRNLARTAIRRADEAAQRGIDRKAALNAVVQFAERLPGDHSFGPRVAAMGDLRARLKIEN